jgi:hypothetical protein
MPPIVMAFMFDERLQAADDEAWNRMLLERGAAPEHLTTVKKILIRVGISKQNLRDLIEIYEGPTDMHQPFPGFGGSDREIEEVAFRLEECKTSFQSHFIDHDS